MVAAQNGRDKIHDGTQSEAVMRDRLRAFSEPRPTLLPKAMIAWAIICLLVLVAVLISALMSI